MKLDTQSMILIIQLVAQGIGAWKEIVDLAKRVENGGKITQFDIDQARAQIDKAVNGWDASVKPDEPTLINNDE